MGTGWGSWVATRLSSYGEVLLNHHCSSSSNITGLILFSISQILACVNVHPLISSAVEAAKEDLYEVLEEVNCPTMMLTCRDNCPNEKPGGLASNVYKWVKTSSPVAFLHVIRFAVLRLLARFVNLRS